MLLHAPSLPPNLPLVIGTRKVRVQTLIVKLEAKYLTFNNYLLSYWVPNSVLCYLMPCPIELFSHFPWLSFYFQSYIFLSKVKKTRWMLVSFSLAPRTLYLLWICSVMSVQVCEQQVVIVWGQALAASLRYPRSKSPSSTKPYETWSLISSWRWQMLR